MQQDEVCQRLMQARLAEMDLREAMLRDLRMVHETETWRKSGYSSMLSFCQDELGYEPLEARAVAIKVGAILTPDHLRADDPVVHMRIQKLRTWRKEQASNEAVAAYRIFTNRTLLAIAHSNPKSENELCAIKGVGPKSVKKYGEALLDALRLL